MIKKFFLYSIIVVIPFVSTFRMPWSAVDDWYMLKVSSQIDKEFETSGAIRGLSTLLNIDKTRVRHSYWASEYILLKTFGSYSALQHFARVLLLYISTVLVMGISYRLFNDDKAALLGGLLFGLLGATSENWIRLGPAEVIETIFMLVSLMLFFKYTASPKRVWFILTSLMCLLVYLSKENSIAWFLVISSLCILEFRKVKKRSVFFLLMLNAIIVSTTTLIILDRNFLGTQDTYGSRSIIFAPVRIIQNIQTYGRLVARELGLLFFPAILGIYIFMTNKKVSKKQKILLIPLALWIISFGSLQILWEFPLGRYLLPFTPPLTIIIGLGINYLLISINNRAVKISILGLVLISLVQNFIDISIVKKSLYNRDIGNWNALKYLSENATPNAVIYSDLSQDQAQIEWSYGLNYLLTSVLNRPDLSLVIPPQPNSKGYLFHWSGAGEYDLSQIKKNYPSAVPLYLSTSADYNFGRSLVSSFAIYLRSRTWPPFLLGSPHQLNWAIYKI